LSAYHKLKRRCDKWSLRRLRKASHRAATGFARKRVGEVTQLQAVDFVGANKHYGEPKGWDERVDGKCHMLHVQQVDRLADRNDAGEVIRLNELPTPECISCWELSFWQAVYLLLTRRVWFRVIGVQPPVSLHVERIYEVLDGEAPYEPSPVSTADPDYVAGVLAKYRGLAIQQMTVAGAREVIGAYGDPLKYLSDITNLDDKEYWQLKMASTMQIV